MISQLKLKNVGPIKQANIKFNNLTIISGRNGVGKTYLSYTYFLLVEKFRDELRNIIVIPKALRTLVEEVAESSSVSIKNASFKLKDFNIREETIKEALRKASSSVDILTDLDLPYDDNVKTQVEGVLDENFLANAYSFEVRQRLYSDLKFELIKEKESDTINIQILKEESIRLDPISIIMDANFIVSFFLTEELFKLNQFPITSERTGISLFNNELTKFNRRGRISLEKNEERYSLPIELNISNYRSIKNRLVTYNDWTQKIKPGFQSQVHEVLGGHYEVDEQEIYFRPKGRNIRVPLKSSSGASKSLMLLDYFMYTYKGYGSLIIDEPELNLHLDSQKEIARILCSVANQGIQVVVTTHSDHFIREINNLIMLSSPKIASHIKQKIMKDSGIRNDSIISPDKVSTVVISAEKRESFEMPVSEYGIDLQLFNDEIMKSNDITNELMMAIYEAPNDK
ncbi:AAA family ATPase [Vibrio vulnificus]|nr:AAA family ATPase [Vibrio vulnificus]